MQDKSDADLLRAYAQRGQDGAFGEIVARYTNLVYSAALRQVASVDLAADVAQCVFVDLARKAEPVSERLTATTSLAGWLHRAARYAALNHLRDTHRRAVNEQQAMEHLLSNADAAADWEQVRPALDEAIDSLDDKDREALLLRYFKNRDFCAVGRALGVSDDAAQKRVSRAVDRLREFFARHGVSISTSGLAVLISANAVQAAPVGLTVSISSAVALTGTASAAVTAATVTKAIAMTVMQKTLVTATVVVLAGAGLYEARHTSALRSENLTLQQERETLAGQVESLARERMQTTNMQAALQEANARLDRDAAELLRLRSEVTRLRTAASGAERSQSPLSVASDPFSQSVLRLATQAGELNQQLERMPDKRIPELQFLSESDWLTAAKDARFQSDEEVRRALSTLRSLAKNKFGMHAAHALDKFIEANQGQLPSDPTQLKPFFEVAVSDEVLRRYEMLHTGNVSDLPKGTEWVISEKAPVDRDYDSHLYVGPKGKSGSWGTGPGSSGDPDKTWATR